MGKGVCHLYEETTRFHLLAVFTVFQSFGISIVYFKVKTCFHYGSCVGVILGDEVD
jgi:hypothetical protein